jgi:transcriptional regulator with XRE-family HTH domain
LSKHFFSFPFSDRIIEMPKTSGKMNPDERAICARLKSFRERIGWNRNSFAAQIALTHARLVSIEHALTPLSYEVAWKIKEVFGLSLMWLVDGNYPPNERDVGRWPDPKTLNNPRELLSEVEKEMWAKIDPDAELKRSNKNKKEDIFNPGAAALAVSLKEDIVNWMARIPEDKAFEFYQELLKFAGDYLDGCPAESEIKIALRERALKWDEMRDEINRRLRHRMNKKIAVDKVGVSANNEGVKHSLPNLLDRLEKATQEHGKKSELANFLGVELVSVSKWLSGAREPGGETTLKMLTWVEQQERQK